ncbi:MAG TPA: hypothetical protein VH120_21840 [Gemmataceae bacterium]|jgi:hypothetical protein|nr:hypothetical protein [Gemmataceae bacterium]
MTTRERRMSILLIGFILVGGVGFFGYQFVIAPLGAKDKQIDNLRGEIANKIDAIARVNARRADVEKWKKLSLPPDAEKKIPEVVSTLPGRAPGENARADQAQRQYWEELNKMAKAAGFNDADVAITPKKPDAKTSPQYATKKPIYTKLDFTVQLKGDMASLVDFMDRFYKVHLLHQIRNITIQKPFGADLRAAAGGPNANAAPAIDLDVTLTIEALVLDNAEQRKTLLPDKAVDVPSPLARSDDEYAKIAGKDMFFGPPSASSRDFSTAYFDTTPFLRLTGISSAPNGFEAMLWDKYHNWEYQISPRSLGGYNVEAFYRLGDRKRSDRDRSGQTLALRDTDGNIMAEWQVVRIDPREVILRDEKGKYFAVHMGDYLAQRKELAKADLDALGIKPEPVKETPKASSAIDYDNP